MPPVYKRHPFIPIEEKRHMVQLRQQGCDVAEIARQKGRDWSTVYRVLRIYRATGEVVTSNLPIGRPRSLDMFDVLVRCMLWTLICMSLTVKFISRSFSRTASNALRI